MLLPVIKFVRRFAGRIRKAHVGPGGTAREAVKRPAGATFCRVLELL
jgi:hypothetical protein